MNAPDRPRVASPPLKPLMVFDGDCGFCRRWIKRWARMTGEAVEYASSEEVAPRFPEIPRATFDVAVQLIDPRGEVYSGAAAVFRALAYRKDRGRWWRLYERFPLFAALAEAGYRFVARHRGLASAATRWMEP